ncbi:MAG: RecX family transcriptional regulator [Chloroflexota bacterium]|nr:RecX family transcriptional regulator [Chloroflexota bacterium]
MAESRIDRAGERRRTRASVDDPAVVMDAAAAFLAVRPRSVAETRRRLRRLGYRQELVDLVVARLTEMGYLDDAAFAGAWVESRDRSAPRGAAALRRELALKGVERRTIEGVLEEREARGGGERRAGGSRWCSAGDRRGVDADHRVSPSAEEAAARRVLERKLPALLRVSDERRRWQKAYALLARNGFDPETCAATIHSVFRRDRS